MTTFATRLERAMGEKSSCLVVGIDPVLERLPAEVHATVGGLAAKVPEREQRVQVARAAAALAVFSREVIHAVAPHAVAVKPNAAFFERYGCSGYDALQEVCREAKKAGLLVILDAKRGDLSSTASAYAESTLGDLEGTPGPYVDATTVNPYFGTDGVKPFIEVARRHDKALFVLVRTSNPSAGEFQELDCGGKPLYVKVAEAVAAWNREEISAEGELGPVGAVVGATAPEQASLVRELLPSSIFLVPGYGAQGAGADSVRPHFLPGGRGALVNASRSVIFSYEKQPADRPWRDAISRAAAAAREELEAVRSSV